MSLKLAYGRINLSCVIIIIIIIIIIINARCTIHVISIRFDMMEHSDFLKSVAQQQRQQQEEQDQYRCESSSWSKKCVRSALFCKIVSATTGTTIHVDTSRPILNSMLAQDYYCMSFAVYFKKQNTHRLTINDNYISNAACAGGLVSSL